MTEARSKSDDSLMLDVRDGKVERLAVLFERHHVQLFNFFLRLTGQRPASEDLVQEVFVRLLKYRQTYRGEDRFIPWMYRIAHNVHVDHVRRNKEAFSLDEQFDEVRSSEPAPEEKVGQSQEAALVAKALVHRAVKELGEIYTRLVREACNHEV